MSIGNQLRQARESQAISLDQAAQATHIRLHYLEALEADKFDLLPSSAQVRGFIRAYGDYLKLNTNELLQSLEGDWSSNWVETAPRQPSAMTSAANTNSAAIFMEIGQKLKSQRELMGLSLGDVERHTHIRMHYIHALEEGDISHLPSPVQGRGMLSNYASFLGLNTEEILLRFADGLQSSLYDRQAARNPSQKKAPAGEQSQPAARPSQLRRLFSMDLFAGGFLIIFLLGFTIWGALRISSFRSNKEPSPTAPPVSEVILTTQENMLSTPLTPAAPGETVPVSTQVTEVSPVVETAQLQQTETPVVTEPTPEFGSAPIQVYIVARQQAWMRVSEDGKIVFEGRTVPGSAYSFSGNDRVSLLTGSGGGLQVYYNQQDLGVLGAFGEVVERIFTIQGILTATPVVLPTSAPIPTVTVTPSGTSITTGTPTTPLATPTP
jgi:cytoskeleton protein RodZ